MLRLDGCSDGFKTGSFGLAGSSVWVEGNSVLPLLSPVFSSEPTLPSSLSDTFSATEAVSAHGVCRGEGGSDTTVVGGQLQKFKGIKGLIEDSLRMRWLKERRTVRWTVQRKKTYFLLCEHLAVLLSYVFVLSGTGQRLGLLYNQTFSLTS